MKDISIDKRLGLEDLRRQRRLSLANDLIIDVTNPAISGGGSGIMKVLELKEDGKWWLAVIKPKDSFDPQSFETNITMWSDDGAPYASPMEAERYGIDKNTGRRQLYAFLFSRKFGRKYVQRLIELMDVETMGE